MFFFVIFMRIHTLNNISFWSIFPNLNNFASAGNRTRIYRLGSDNADHYTTDAMLTCQKIRRSEVTFYFSYILMHWIHVHQFLTLDHSFKTLDSATQRFLIDYSWGLVQIPVSLAGCSGAHLLSSYFEAVRLDGVSSRPLGVDHFVSNECPL